MFFIANLLERQIEIRLKINTLNGIFPRSDLKNKKKLDGKNIVINSKKNVCLRQWRFEQRPKMKPKVVEQDEWKKTVYLRMHGCK